MHHRNQILNLTAAALAGSLLAGCATTESTSSGHSSWGSSYRAVQGTEQPARNAGFRAASEAEFELLKKSVLFTDDDVRYLRLSRAVLEPNVDELLDVWYGFVGSNEHLVYYFSHPTTKQPDGEYLDRVRGRFREWVLTTADADFDQDWLNHQLEIGLRHHRLKKNRTDGVEAVDHIPMRYVIALHYPITTTLKPFLARGGHSDKDVQGMYEAWRKAVLMTAILWSQPYVEPGDF
ncbi:MAG: hypothetical protein KDA20_00270 [Phycisphaerales bacterium]|nr:hypothetical protein [Phycisphaerales bacterium]